MKKEVLVFEKDSTGKLDTVFTAIRTKYFPKLIHAKINYIFRTTQKKDDEGYLILGEAKKLPNRERDLYGYDFEICIHKETWEKASKKKKRRIAWHELNHLVVKYKFKMNEPMIDRAGRIQIALHNHDIVIKTFEEELRLFGPMKYQKKSIKKIASYIKNISKKEKR